jgi:hypothetical protein
MVNVLDCTYRLAILRFGGPTGHYQMDSLPNSLDETSFEIARFLATKAKRRSRTTYPAVAQAIGWGHPQGRGLGDFLYEILHFCKDHQLPPLTAILVTKGTTTPPDDSLKYFRAALGDIDIDKSQREVFDFDWSAVFPPAESANSDDTPAMWLTSFWGFSPETWGCIGFSSESRRQHFLTRTRPGVLVAIYVTKAKGQEDERGRVVGFLEVSHRTGHLREFIAGDAWAWTERDPASRGKWEFALRVTRAWRIAPEERPNVDDAFPDSYSTTKAEFIGAQGVRVTAEEAASLLDLTVFEVPVHGQTDPIDGAIQPMRNALKPSRAVYPGKEPYWVGEIDGPKHLYILRLEGDIARYLGRSQGEVADKLIVKVGFSKSPLSRRDQIQAAYPEGTFRWQVLYPKTIPGEAPYPNARIAIAGEDAMKARLENDGAKSLGREFFLADEGLVIRTWAAGANAANEALKKLQPNLATSLPASDARARPEYATAS